MTKKSVAAVISLVLVAGCAKNYEPAVDLGSSPAPASDYQRNLAECQSLAARESPVEDAAIGGAVGAAAGAAVGAITGAFFGGAGRGAAVGAALGGVGGAGVEGYRGTANQKAIVRNCLEGRGYNVVGD